MCNHPPKKRRPDELMDDLTEAIKFDDYGKMFDNDKLKPIINISIKTALKKIIRKY